jgi:hypothetical protein
MVGAIAESPGSKAAGQGVTTLLKTCPHSRRDSRRDSRCQRHPLTRPVSLSP